MGEVDVSILGVSGPKLAGGIPIDHDSLHATFGDGYGEAFIERVAVGGGIVAVAQEAGVGAFRVRMRSGANHVQMSVLPKGVGPGGVALVDERAGVAPGVRCPVVTVYAMLLGRPVEEYRPPGAVIEPQLAL